MSVCSDIITAKAATNQHDNCVYMSARNRDANIILPSCQLTDRCVHMSATMVASTCQVDEPMPLNVFRRK